MRTLKMYGWFFLGVLIITVIMLLAGCTVIRREYNVFVYATEGSTITFKAEVLAEVPKDIDIDADLEGNVDLPDANVIGK